MLFVVILLLLLVVVVVIFTSNSNSIRTTLIKIKILLNLIDNSINLYSLLNELILAILMVLVHDIQFVIANEYVCADFPEQVVGLSVTEVTINSVALVWTFQMNGSDPRIRTEIEIRRFGTLVRTDMIAPQFSGAQLSPLLPLSTYNFTVYVVSNVGRSRPSVVSTSTLSLSN